jgi:transglutaminase-like putative cysteine protease
VHGVEYIHEPEHRITGRTIQEMHGLVRKAKIDPKVQEMVAFMVRRCQRKDYWCEASTVFDFSKRYVRYIRDPDDVELIQSVWKTLGRRAGDCDDGTILISGLLSSIGFPYRFVTLKASPTRPDEWSHVYPEIHVPGRGWTAADWSVTQASLGWEPERYYEKRAWPAPKES